MADSVRSLVWLARGCGTPAFSFIFRCTATRRRPMQLSLYARSLTWPAWIREKKEELDLCVEVFHIPMVYCQVKYPMRLGVYYVDGNGCAPKVDYWREVIAASRHEWVSSSTGYGSTVDNRSTCSFCTRSCHNNLPPYKSFNEAKMFSSQVTSTLKKRKSERPERLGAWHLFCFAHSNASDMTYCNRRDSDTKTYSFSNRFPLWRFSRHKSFKYFKIKKVSDITRRVPLQASGRGQKVKAKSRSEKKTKHLERVLGYLWPNYPSYGRKK